jgi:hypothetical protein
MTEVELLKLQIEALEKLVKIKQDTVAELERQLTLRPLFQPLPQISIPSVWQVDPCQHEYPETWGGTVPPSCKKCGKSMTPYYTVTCSNNAGAL